MKRYLLIIWENLFLKTFDYKGKSNREEFIICNVFWWIFLGISVLICISISDAADSDFVEVLSLIPVFVLILIRIIPFTSLRVRRLHDIGESGSKLIFIYLVALIAPIGLGFIWLMSHMYEKTLVTDEIINVDPLTNVPPPINEITGNIETEEVEL